MPAAHQERPPRQQTTVSHALDLTSIRCQIPASPVSHSPDIIPRTSPRPEAHLNGCRLPLAASELI
ncbi:hypothetical protein BKA81DRAFT_210469 [Phyllosticta paracitricarpa]